MNRRWYVFLYAITIHVACDIRHGMREYNLDIKQLIISKALRILC